MAYTAMLERTVALSRKRVYAQLIDFGGIERLVPDEVESVQMAGAGIGSVRTVRLKGADGKLAERLEASIEDRLISYSITENTLMPMEHYHAVVELADAPGGGCTIRWGSNWVAKGAPESDVRDSIVALYDRIIDGILKVG